jgi:hypothetical protein
LSNVRKLFPKVDVPDLARMYQADVPSDQLEEALHAAAQDPSIEYLEEPASRRLIV